MPKCIFAYTEPHYPYPGYVNLSIDDDGKYIVTVRTQGTNGTIVAHLEVPSADLKELAKSILVDLSKL